MNKHDKSTWDDIQAMPDAQAEANAMSDPDNPSTDAQFWADVGMQEPDTRKGPYISAWPLRS